MQIGAVSNQADRLMQARKSAGYETAAEAARAMGIPEPTYVGHENGFRGLTRQASRYARFFGVPLEWLLEGRNPPKFRSRVKARPLLGYVGAGAQVIPVDDHAMGAALDEIEAPPGAEDMVCVRVRGESMFPAYEDGDVIFFTDRREGSSVEDLINRQCIVGLADGRVYLKQLMRGKSPGTYTLISFNAPPIQDQIVDWAARVSIIKKGG